MCGVAVQWSDALKKNTTSTNTIINYQETLFFYTESGLKFRSSTWLWLQRPFLAAMLVSVFLRDGNLWESLMYHQIHCVMFHYLQWTSDDSGNSWQWVAFPCEPEESVYWLVLHHAWLAAYWFHFFSLKCTPISFCHEVMNIMSIINT